MKSRSIQAFYETLYIRGFDNKEQILLEAIRVSLVHRHVQEQGISFSNSPDDQERLFQVMKQVSEHNKLGHFPGDREFFYHLYSLTDNLDLLDLLVQLNRHDRTGIMMAPDYLVDDMAHSLLPRSGSVLIAEAEKFSTKLAQLIQSHPAIEFTLTTEKYVPYLILTTVFAASSNVRVVNQSVYRELLLQEKFDAIICLPSFGGRLTPEETGSTFMTRDSECIALENLVQHLQAGGQLTAIVPARVTFASGSVQDFRRWLADQYHIDAIYALAEGMFRPFSSIKTYVLTLSKATGQAVAIGRMVEEDSQLVRKQTSHIQYQEFKQLEDWRIDLFFAEDHETIQRFKAASVAKVKLKEIAEVFRGKSVMKDDIQPGKIGVVNISNIEDGEIMLDSIDTIKEEERKIKRYQLLKDDVVITCRGTVNKVALFPVTERVVIASANIIAIRLTGSVLPAYLKIFLESPVGQMLTKSFQRGTTVMNINPADLVELEIPLLSLDKQTQLVEEFCAKYKHYRQALAEVEQRWAKERGDVYNQFIGGGE